MADDNSTILSLLKGIDPADAMPFGAGTTPQGSPTALSGILGGVMNVPKNLIDAAKVSTAHTYGPPPATMSTDEPPFVDPLPTESTKAAMMLMGGGAPAAEAGAAGIFGGKLAKTADLDKMVYALRNQGVKTPTEIWNETGWFKSPTDHQMKFEIPDANAQMLGHGLDYSEEGAALTGPAHAMFQHPELYKAYPRLGQHPMTNSVYQNPNNGVGTGLFDSEGVLRGEPVVSVNAPDLKRATSIGLHEMQHGVQDLEGFATGGQPSTLARMQELEPTRVPIHELKSDPHDMYLRLAGEVESRNVQFRHILDKLDQGSGTGKVPWHPDTMDTPYQNQLVYTPRRGIITSLRGYKSE